ncbi:glycosyltransferase [Mucilaginibacter sp. SP1R1]|uniref:glycosyltransferase n=1 Tax=Mucilaginibacter sp. SP1R1 TaxID=2723091 RepID=UPI0017BF4B14|nr:glycosyltransferase [Mucilaginibacter sp. SP1R1]MBB6150992.1 glycosyltransferase involved in cell wall biosynthesis [Mucilaginibacter sp. SP1R1]
MKIAVTADPELAIPPILYGGIERIIYMLIVELLKEKHDVTLFAHKNSDVPCKLVVYPCTGNSMLDVLKNSWTISKTIFAEKFDIIHSFGRLAYLIPLMPLRIPILMSYQRIPTINQIKRAMWLSKQNTISFTGCSNYITNLIKPFAPAFTIYNGIDINKYTLAEEVSDDAPLIFLGRIEHIKGAHKAIEIAFKSNRKLLIAGNIPIQYQKYFDENIKPYLGNQIKYIGSVNDEQKNQLLRKACALLMPILWDEPFGIVMIEAMACGTPVIGFCRGAVPEVIDHGRSGFIGKTSNNLVDFIKMLESIDRRSVKELVKKRFSSGVITDQYIKLYKVLINNCRS